MAQESECRVMVSEPPGFWHQHECGRPVKAEFKNRVDGTLKKVCGIHAKVYDRRRDWDRI